MELYGLGWSLFLKFKYLTQRPLQYASYISKNKVCKILSRLINLKTFPKKVKYLNYGIVFQFFQFISNTILLTIKMANKTIIINNHIFYKKDKFINSLNLLFYIEL